MKYSDPNYIFSHINGYFRFGLYLNTYNEEIGRICKRKKKRGQFDTGGICRTRRGGPDSDP